MNKMEKVWVIKCCGEGLFVGRGRMGGEERIVGWGGGGEERIVG